MKFDQLGLSESLLRATRAEGYETATPIQAQAIPTVLEGHDLMGCAQTGTGKTAAFAMPTLHTLSEGNQRTKLRTRPIRALVLVPTRELAVQVTASFAKYGKFTQLRSTTIYGGVNQNPQVRALQKGVDIVVATPGRLLDLMNQGHVDLKHVEVLILDEADQMLDMGFLPDLTRIVSAVPKDRQTLMFSATMPDAIRRLAGQWLNDPKHVQVSPNSSPVDTVKQSVFLVNTQHKPQLLTHYLQNTAWERTLVFARTKHGADKIVKHLLRAGIRAAAIHGNKSQNARARTLEQFKSQRPPVLVATDIAARGLDVDAVTHVINYELPEVPEIYVHRIGRTGRAGASGIATSFCGGEERGRLRQIERLTRRSINIEKTQPEYALPEKSTSQSNGDSSRPRRSSGRPQSGKKNQSASSRPKFAKSGAQKTEAQVSVNKPRRPKRRPRRVTTGK
ncbi:DEAD/DEAH box helicase [Bythopirellula polymerisocia]|uniref:DEAD-box ATP-dependent RNA helicase RhpA n=1 Tax=Bythopirellula polymerisocia TaxID=2528003 RepID=A0A5C6CLB7_9BACT|nr:DEAD/DEAH box helicase [Bythopirellula polymerisocia]TWU25683.1 ATP-dependent RNA helicase RhlE [Bythopirellula polymerisocia]